MLLDESVAVKSTVSLPMTNRNPLRPVDSTVGMPLLSVADTFQVTKPVARLVSAITVMVRSHWEKVGGVWSRNKRVKYSC